MLTQLSTIRSRLALDPLDLTPDPLLLRAIEAVSARFDKECNRTFARNPEATEEFSGDDTEIPVACYPIETVAAFQLKTTEDEGWLDQPRPPFVLRRACVISLPAPLGASNQQARVTYAGGYVLPGTSPAPGQVSLPLDLEQAVVEQVAFWFQKRDKLGLKTCWPKGVTNDPYVQFAVTERAISWTWLGFVSVDDRPPFGTLARGNAQHRPVPRAPSRTRPMGTPVGCKRLA